ncbi:AI-2E family transporter [Candidatus Nitrotoga sp. M5]|uniref:AI-2E family transporter n=1 Tax=Candidatus Nitrotoga sp. M5 TaxID=2890409 RepID=UPI001EF2C0A0|nr:AI-2E family transporter [Candidatus Nitrotoga sp. M5]CAH1386995.1 putative permease PerM [Candidatus Nitrotoga sp. M5]
MISVLRNWFQRYFSNEEAVVLFVVLVGSFAIILTTGGILGPVFVSVVLAFLMQGLVTLLTARGVPHMLSVSLVVTIFMSFLFALIFLLFPLVWGQVISLFGELPRMLEKGRALLQALPEEYPELVNEVQIESWIGMAGKELGSLGQWALSNSMSTITNIVSLLIYLILVPILVFFFLKDKDVITSWFSSMLPRQRGLMSKVWWEMDAQIANYIRGKAIEILVVGSASYAVFALMGLNYAILLGILVGLSVIIPYVGAAVVTVPVAMIGASQWGWTSEFFYLMMAYGIIQALDGNVLVPFLFSEVVNLHPVAIIVAVLFFGSIWGLWGVFFAIPLATLIQAVLNAWPRGNSSIGPPIEE